MQYAAPYGHLQTVRLYRIFLLYVLHSGILEKNIECEHGFRFSVQSLSATFLIIQELSEI